MGAEDRQGEADVTPRRSCVVHAGILLTRGAITEGFQGVLGVVFGDRKTSKTSK